MGVRYLCQRGGWDAHRVLCWKYFPLAQRWCSFHKIELTGGSWREEWHERWGEKEIWEEEQKADCQPGLVFGRKEVNEGRKEGRRKEEEVEKVLEFVDPAELFIVLSYWLLLCVLELRAATCFPPQWGAQVEVRSLLLPPANDWPLHVCLLVFRMWLWCLISMAVLSTRVPCVCARHKLVWCTPPLPTALNKHGCVCLDCKEEG